MQELKWKPQLVFISYCIPNKNLNLSHQEITSGIISVILFLGCKIYICIIKCNKCEYQK